MKRIVLCVILVLAATVMAPVSVAAVGSTTYEIEDIGVSIALAEDQMVFTRDMEEDHPNLAKYEMTKEELESTMVSGNAYLYAWDEDISYQIKVVASDSVLKDFYWANDDVLNFVALSAEFKYKEAGGTYIKSEIYPHSQTKFIKMYMDVTRDGDTIPELQYYTVHGGKDIIIALFSYDGEIDAEKENTLKTIVDSIRFLDEPKAEEIPAELLTDAFVYNDMETGTSFTVPENWSKGASDREQDTFNIEFTSNVNPVTHILYAWTDAWADLSPLERVSRERADIDNTIVTKADFAEVFEVPEDDVKIVVYGKNRYYKVERITTTDVYDLSISTTITQLFHFDNGYIYIFQFNDSSNNKYYKDFEALLTSVEYSRQGSVNKSDTDAANRFVVWKILISLFVTIAVYSLPIVIYRYAVVKTPLDKKKAKKIALIYGVCAFVAMSILAVWVSESGVAGGGMLLWSWVNYHVLVAGKPKKQDEDMFEAER